MSPSELSLLPKLFWVILSVVAAIAYGLIIGGIIRKVMARVQGRIGPPVYQPYIDLFKVLFQRTATWHGYMFYLGPVFRATGGIGLFLFIPVVFGDPRFDNFSFNGDLLIVMYFMFFGSLGLALGSGEGGHPHSIVAVSRGLTQMPAFELPFSLAVVAIAAQTGSFSLHQIVAAQQGGIGHWFLVSNPLAAVAAFLAFLGMNMYSPFNIVIAPQEIPIGPPTEYNSAFMSIMMTGRAIFVIAKCVLYMDLFLGGATTILEAVVKIFLIYFWSVFVGAVFPRFRTEQTVRFFLGWPTAAGVAAVLAVMLF